MKVTLATLLDPNPNQVLPHHTLVKVLESHDIPAKTTYWLGKLKRTVDVDLGDFTEKRMLLFQKYGQQTETGYTLVGITEDDLQAFNTEMLGLLSNEMEYPDKYAVTLEDIVKVGLNAIEMATLDWLIKEPEVPQDTPKAG